MLTRPALADSDTESSNDDSVNACHRKTIAALQRAGEVFRSSGQVLKAALSIRSKVLMMRCHFDTNVHSVANVVMLHYVLPMVQDVAQQNANVHRLLTPTIQHHY